MVARLLFIKNCVFSFGEKKSERCYHPSNVIYHYYLFVQVNKLEGKYGFLAQQYSAGGGGRSLAMWRWNEKMKNYRGSGSAFAGESRHNESHEGVFNTYRFVLIITITSG